MSDAMCIVITRRANMQTLMRNIEYINSLDTTIMGSRNGHSALIVWHSLVGKGICGLRHETMKCVEIAKYLYGQLKSRNIDAMLNDLSCTVVIPRPSNAFVQRWQLACDKSIANVVVMPNITRIKVDAFVEEYVNDQMFITSSPTK